jgi:hypothetical protein
MAKKEDKNTGNTLGKMAALYKMDIRTLNKNIEKIRPELDKIAGRKRYIRLIPKQIELIIAHLGEP